jgi:hypothetical protein
VAELERLISESQAATAHLIKAMDESRRALKEAVCEVEEKELRIIQRGSRVAIRENPALVPVARRQPPLDQSIREPRIENGGVHQAIAGPAGSESKAPDQTIQPAQNQGNVQGAATLVDTHGGPDRTGDYQAVVEMARKGMSETEIFERSELTEAEISLVLELGRKRKEFN